MKNILFGSLLFLFSCTDSSKTETVSTSSDTVLSIDTPVDILPDTVIRNESKVESIRSIVQSINEQNLLVQTFTWNEPSCADAGTIRYFLNGDEIVKVVETGFIGD